MMTFMKAPELLVVKGTEAMRSHRSCVAVLGVGDVGTAVGHALHRAGAAVLLIETSQPTAPRRGMCWVDAVFDGVSTVAGLSAVRVFCPEEADQAMMHRCWLPLAVEPDVPAWLSALDVSMLVDARLRKHAAGQPDLRDLAALTVGIGPGYMAGYNADYVVESAWGEDLGRVIERGSALALSGEPRPILGFGRERLVYSPAKGRFASTRCIADSVLTGDLIGQINTADGCIPLFAPLSGVLRGLTRPGVQVQQSTKLVEVDPRNDPGLCFGLGERPRCIAQGVVEIWQRVAGLQHPSSTPDGPERTQGRGADRPLWGARTFGPARRVADERGALPEAPPAK